MLVINENEAYRMIEMIMNTTSNDIDDEVALIITSCARWDLLEITINSFEQYNTYSYIYIKLVIDDCDDIVGLKNMSLKFPNYTFVQTKTPRTKPYKNRDYRVVLSIKEAVFHHIINKYKQIQYVFMCEDDWKFYKYGFIEDSFAILKSNYNQKYLHPKISFVQLRNVQYFQPYLSTFHFCGGWELFRIEGFGNITNIYTSNIDGYKKNKIKYYIHGDDTMRAHECWGHFSFNPGLKSIEHFKLLWKNITIQPNSQCTWEYCVACLYKKHNLSLAITAYNGYIGHQGHKTRHVQQKINIKKRRNMLINISNHDITVINDKIAIDNTNCMYLRINNV